MKSAQDTGNTDSRIVIDPTQPEPEMQQCDDDDDNKEKEKSEPVKEIIVSIS